MPATEAREEGARRGRGGEGEEGTHFDVKQGAPGPQPRSTRRYCYYEPGSLLIIEKEPEVAACDTTGVLRASRRMGEGEGSDGYLPGMILPRVAR